MTRQPLLRRGTDCGDARPDHVLLREAVARELAGGYQLQIVSAGFTATDGCIYVQEPDGSSGLRVSTTQTGLAPGDRVNVSGRISARMLSDYASERVMENTTSPKSPRAHLQNRQG